MPKKLKRVGKTVRTVLQIIRSLLKDALEICSSCKGVDFEQHPQVPDYNWLAKNVPDYQKCGPPNQNSAYHIKKEVNNRFANRKVTSANQQKTM